MLLPVRDEVVEAILDFFGQEVPVGTADQFPELPLFLPQR